MTEDKGWFQNKCVTICGRELVLFCVRFQFEKQDNKNNEILKTFPVHKKSQDSTTTQHKTDCENFSTDLCQSVDLVIGNWQVVFN